MRKVSIRFYHDTPVRAVWSEEQNIWYFSVLDIISAIRGGLECPVLIEEAYEDELETFMKKYDRGQN